MCSTLFYVFIFLLLLKSKNNITLGGYMKKITVSKTEISFLFIPFKYKDTLIIATSFEGVPGLYGVKKEALVFMNTDILDDTFIIEVPDNIEELANITQAMEFIVQQQAVNKDAKILGFDGEINHVSKLKPFVKFMTNYEKGLQYIEGIKNGVIT